MRLLELDGQPLNNNKPPQHVRVAAQTPPYRVSPASCRRNGAGRRRVVKTR